MFDAIDNKFMDHIDTTCDIFFRKCRLFCNFQLLTHRAVWKGQNCICLGLPKNDSGHDELYLPVPSRLEICILLNLSDDLLFGYEAQSLYNNRMRNIVWDIVMNSI